MTWHQIVGTKGLSKGLRASGPKGLEPNYYLNLSTALDIQHFLKPFTVTAGEMPCHAVMIQID